MNNILKDEDFKRKFPIKLVKHNKEWVTWYEDEKTNLLAKLEQYKVSLYHIGSTAISNIYSKDIIPSLSLRKKNNRQKTRNTKVKSLLFFIFVLL